MYPTMVIVLVKTQRSMVDLCAIGPSNAYKPADLVVAQAKACAATLSMVGSIHSAMDNELESQRCRAVQNPERREYGVEKAILERQ